MFNHSLNYGSIAGLLAFGMFILYEFLGINPLGGASWLSAWIPVVFIVLAIRKQRQEQQDAITYAEGLKEGIIVTFIYASLFAMLVVLYGSFLSEEFLEIHKNESLEAMEQMEKFLSEDTINQAVDEIDAMSVSAAAFNDFMAKFLGGLITALIAAGVLKKEKSIFEDPSI